MHFEDSPSHLFALKLDMTLLISLGMEGASLRNSCRLYQILRSNYLVLNPAFLLCGLKALLSFTFYLEGVESFFWLNWSFVAWFWYHTQSTGGFVCFLPGWIWLNTSVNYKQEGEKVCFFLHLLIWVAPCDLKLPSVNYFSPEDWWMWFMALSKQSCSLGKKKWELLWEKKNHKIIEWKWILKIILFQPPGVSSKAKKGENSQ